MPAYHIMFAHLATYVAFMCIVAGIKFLVPASANPLFILVSTVLFIFFAAGAHTASISKYASHTRRTVAAFLTVLAVTHAIAWVIDPANPLTAFFYAGGALLAFSISALFFAPWLIVAYRVTGGRHDRAADAP